MKWTSWCNAILGVWLIIAPWLIGFSTGVAATNSLVLGVIVLIAALTALGSMNAARAARWVNVIAGIWLIISPWVLHLTMNSNVVANDVIAGALTTIFAWIGLATMNRVTVA